MEDCQEISVQLFIPGCNSAELFDFIEESLHKIAIFIPMAIIVSWVEAVATGRNHSLRSHSLNG